MPKYLDFSQKFLKISILVENFRKISIFFKVFEKPRVYINFRYISISSKIFKLLNQKVRRISILV